MTQLVDLDDHEMLLLESLVGREIDRHDPSPYRDKLEILRRKLEAPANTDKQCPHGFEPRSCSDCSY